MNITEYIKSLLYEYRLNMDKETLMKMRHNLWQIKRGNVNGTN